MTCRRSEEVDLLAFAVDRQAAEWADFRDHYPRCADCARAVARLASLEQALADGEEGEAVHLDEDELLAFAEGRLAPVASARIEAHVAQCAPCRTEVSVMMAPAPELLAAPARAPRRAAAPAAAGPGLLERLAGWLQPRPAWGLAAAAAAAAAVALVVGSLVGGPPPESTRLVERPPEVAPEPERTPEPPGPAPEPSPRLARDAPLPEPPPAVAPPPTGPERPAAEQLAEAPPATEPQSRPASAEEPLLREAEAIELAALLPSELPSYAVPDGVGAAVRIGGALRAGGSDLPRLSVLAPEHPGVTVSAAPTLYWALDRRSDYPVEIVLIDPEGVDPLLERRVEPPLAAGLHAIDLTLVGVELEPGRRYDWSVSLLPGEGGRDADVVSLAGIRRAEDPAPAEGGASSEERARAIHRLAAAGYWYDAFERANRWLADAPASERLHDYRAALIEQVGLGEVDAWIAAPPE